MIVIDAGVLVAAADRSDADHERCVAWLAKARTTLLVPAPALAEAGYLVARSLGTPAEAHFLRGLAADHRLMIVAPGSDDLARAADILDQYADLRLGTSDAVLVALAERLAVTRVATVDLRHFRAIRPRHASHFTLLPDDAE